MEEEKHMETLVEKRKGLQYEIQQLQETAIKEKEIAVVDSERKNEEVQSWESSIEYNSEKTKEKGIHFMEDKTHVVNEPNRGITGNYTYRETLHRESCYNCGKKGHIAVWCRYEKTRYRCSGRRNMAKEYRGDRMETQYRKEIQRGRTPRRRSWGRRARHRRSKNVE